MFFVPSPPLLLANNLLLYLLVEDLWRFFAVLGLKEGDKYSV